MEPFPSAILISTLGKEDSRRTYPIISGTCLLCTCLLKQTVLEHIYLGIFNEFVLISAERFLE